MTDSESTHRVIPVFLLGKTPDSKFGRSKTQQNLQADRILRKYELDTESKHLIRKENEILGINLHGTEAFIIFPYCSDRFAPLIYLAETKKPIIIVSEEDTFKNALETHQYLANHDNVELAFSPREVKAKIKAINASKLLQSTKICLFDAGEWKLEGIAWQKNPLFSNRLNVENINIQKFLENVQTADPKKAEALAKRWMKNARIREPSLADVTKTAQIYLGMKRTLREMKSKVVYVLWCGQFTKKLQAKMCFALAKLADDGYPTGCWRGENLLPLLMLHTASKKPIFTAEAFTHKGDTITLRHCFAPTKLAQGKYVLRRWRNMEGTVTAYCQLPKGEVTLVNCGIGDRMVVTKGRVIDCKDLGGQNCRMTVWIKMEKPELIAKLVAREFAMAYGNYEEEVVRTAKRLGLKVLT